AGPVPSPSMHVVSSRSTPGWWDRPPEAPCATDRPVLSVDVGKVHESIDGRLRDFIEAQHMFFVATAPSGSDGHVNVSPKGIGGSLVILGEHTVAYLDYTASGAETIAHLRDNGR